VGVARVKDEDDADLEAGGDPSDNGTPDGGGDANRD
jgi:hypothetical protein